MEIIRFVDVFGKSQADIQPDVLQLDFWFGRHFLERTENPPQQLEEGIKKLFFTRVNPCIRSGPTACMNIPFRYHTMIPP